MSQIFETDMAHCLAHIPPDKAFNGHSKSAVDKIFRQGGKLTAAFLKLIEAGVNSKDSERIIVDEEMEVEREEGPGEGTGTATATATATATVTARGALTE